MISNKLQEPLGQNRSARGLGDVGVSLAHMVDTRFPFGASRSIEFQQLVGASGATIVQCAGRAAIVVACYVRDHCHLDWHPRI